MANSLKNDLTSLQAENEMLKEKIKAYEMEGTICGVDFFDFLEAWVGDTNGETDTTL